MKKFFLIVVPILILNISKGQNLISNPSFETIMACSSYTGPPLLPCINWYQYGSSDLFCSLSATCCGLPPISSCIFGCQLPRTGNNYAGFTASGYPYVAGYREFIVSQLTISLISNHTYYVNFYVSSGNTCHIYVDKIGAYFSADSLSPDSDYLFNLIPQVENPTGNIITDSINWVAISGYFTAQGGEKWITIGNFRDDAHTQFDSIANWTDVEAYYFLDDVSVIDCTATGINEQQQIAFTLIQNPVTNSVGFTSPLQIQTATVFTTVGAMVKQVHFSNTINYSFDVADLPRGIYFLQVETKDKRKGIRKFVKQ